MRTVINILENFLIGFTLIGFGFVSSPLLCQEKSESIDKRPNQIRSGVAIPEAFKLREPVVSEPEIQDPYTGDPATAARSEEPPLQTAPSWWEPPPPSFPLGNFITIIPETCGTVKKDVFQDTFNGETNFSYDATHSCEMNLPIGSKPDRVWLARRDAGYFTYSTLGTVSDVKIKFYNLKDGIKAVSYCDIRMENNAISATAACSLNAPCAGEPGKYILEIQTHYEYAQPVDTGNYSPAKIAEFRKYMPLSRLMNQRGWPLMEYLLIGLK